MSRWFSFTVSALCAWVLVATAAPSPAATDFSTVQSGAIISGTVVDASLTPLAGASVLIERNGRVVAKTTTDDKGAFRFTGIASGDYRVRAERSGFPAFTRDLRVPAGATTLNLPIVLARPEDALPDAKAEAVQVRSGTAVVSGRGGGVAGGRPGGVVGGVVGGIPAPTAPPPPAQGAGRGVANVLPSGAPVEQPRGVDYQRPGYYPQSGETYTPIDPNRFQSTHEHPLSTFGADVDTASYANVRRFLSSGQLPPRDAVRVEEFVNYFRFAYAAPRDGRPISLTTEIGDCPWAPSHKLVLIGARAATTAAREIEGRNIVLLIDVSGSMAPPERLPLIKTALGMFVDTLRPDDTLSIVTYAGSSGVALHPTPARRREVIQSAIANLSAGGSTNGAQGLITAYRIARQAFIPGGVNRVILASDGDFNVGIVSQHDLHRLIERERESGVFLSIFGVGSGNLKDATMEMLADKGNGHYSYLDSLQEARRVLIREADATLETVAKDVKFQVEFNPAVVSAWKLIGYENRALAARDFNDDRKDAGEMGAGHSVTVLYEVVPVGADREGIELERPLVDPLKYQPDPRPDRPVVTVPQSMAGEWLTVKARYKLPEGDQSALISLPVRAGGRTQHLALASAVAEFGLLLRDAPRNEARWEALVRRVDRLSVPAAQAADVDGFKELVAIGRGLAKLR